MEITARNRKSRSGGRERGTQRRNQAALILAYSNVVAELGYAEGEALYDDQGNDLPSVIAGRLTGEEQKELLEAARVMREFYPFERSVMPRLSAHPQAVVYLPVRSGWDLERLIQAFENGSKKLAPESSLQVERVTDERAPLLVRATHLDTATRLLCLKSSLDLLASECFLLKMRLARPGLAKCPVDA